MPSSDKTILNNVQGAISMFKSNRVSERKKGAERLMELLSESDNVCRTLDSNSVHKDKNGEKLTWGVLFNEVCEYFTKETDKLTTSHVGSAAKNYCFSVVHRVFQKGTCHRPWIAWNNIFTFIVSHLSQDTHVLVYGSALVSMLHNFLSIEPYVSIIVSHSWIELIKLLLKLYVNGKYNIPPFTLLQCINICIQEGSNHPTVISTLRSDVVQFYENIFTTDKAGTRTNISIILRGFTSLCRKNAVEFRGIICKLGELLIPRILNSSNYTNDEEGVIVELLLVQLQIHSPCDTSMKDTSAFLANDCRRWTEIVKSIYVFCLDALDDIAIKKNSHFNKDLQVSDKLILLAAKCTKLVYMDGQLDEPSSSGDEDEPNPTKKSMRCRSFQNVLSDICSRVTPNESQIVWMNYLTGVFTQFPQLVSTRLNFGNLFQMGTTLLKSTYVTRRDVYLFLLCLLNTEKHLIGTGVLKSRSKCWENVWDLTIRSLSVSEFKIEALELLRKILIEIQPSNVHSLLLVYTGGAIPVTPASLNLLAEYLSRCSLPLYLGSDSHVPSTMEMDVEIASTSCPRSSLIRWLLNSSTATMSAEEFHELGLGHEPLISTILCSLLVRQTHNLIYAERFCFRPNISMKVNIPSELGQFESVYEDFEKLLLKCCFVREPGIEAAIEQKRNSPTEPEVLKLSLIPTIPLRLVESLMEDFEKLPVFDHTSPDFIKKFTQLNYRVALYLNSINVLEKYTIGTRGGEDFGFRTNLEKLFDKALSRCVELTIDFMIKGKQKTALQVHELVVVLRNILKSSQLCDGVKVMLAQRFPQHLQELLKKAYRSNLVRYLERAANNPSDTLMFGSKDILARFISGGDEDGGISESRQIELVALESLGCLIDYGVICDHSIDLFSDILRDCINETYNSFIPFIFEFSSELIIRLIPALTSSSMEREYTDVLTLMTNLLQKMSKGFYLVPHCSAKLWEFFSDITGLTSRDSDVNKKNLMILVGTLTAFMKTGKPHGSSILVCQPGFKALTELAKSDPELLWSVFTPKSGPECWVLNEAYEFLNNPSHQIRLFANETICTTFESAAPLCAVQPAYPEIIVTRPWPLTEYFDKIYEFVQKTFSISTNLTSDENAEEAVNRTSIALACLSRLIFAYPFIQKKTIFSFLQLIQEKSIDIALSYRALLYASSTVTETMCCHVSFLLHEWLAANYKIDDFPYAFFGCESMAAFYNKFRKEIIVEFFLKNDTEGLSEIAKFFGGEPIEDLITECYGMLMARIVPVIAVYKYQSIAGKDVTQLQELQKRLNTTLGGKIQTESLMMTRLEDVVMQLVSLVFDAKIPSAWGCPNTFVLPEPSSTHYDENSVDIGLKFLRENSSRKDVSLIAYLATHTPKAIYDTLLILITRVHNSHDALEKFWRLHQFAYFVKQLLQEQPPIFNTMKEYVCQFVVHGYIRLLNLENGKGKYSQYLRESLVFLISQLVLTLTLNYTDEMKQHYYTVVNNLVVSVVRHPDLLKAAKKPLDILLIRYQKDFVDCIATLDPFPSNKVSDFDVYKDVLQSVKYGHGGASGSSSVKSVGNTKSDSEWSLFKELKSYLDNGSERWTLERLVWIRELLSLKKRDVEKLVRLMEGKRFSDECQSEVLHALIQTLLSVIKNGTDQDVVIEAARCLGEIGPVDLSVLVLPNCTPKKREIKGMAGSLLTIMQILVDYLKADDIKLVTTSGDVLRALCRTTECAELINKDFTNTRTDAILKPFKVTQGTIPKTPEKVYPNVIETKLGLNEMNECLDYKTWLTQLTCGLIECFKEGDSVIASLLSVCRIKVEFCQEILPFVFYVLLYSGRMNPLVRKTVSGYFRNFFTKCLYNLANSSDCSRSFTPVVGVENQGSIYTNKLALRNLIGVIQFLRIHPAPQEYKGSSKITPWDSNFWMDISYFDLSRAAQHCGAYLTSILFTEVAVTELDMGVNSHVEDSVEEDMDAFYSQGNLLIPASRGGIRGESMELLLKAYTSIGEPDAVYGCGSARFSDGVMNISHLQQRRQFFRVLSAADGNALDSNSSTKAGVAGALKDLALYNSLWTYLKGAEAEDKMLDYDLAEIQYECGWRLSKWNLHCDKATYLKDGSFFENSRTHGMLQRFVYESVQTGLAKDVVNHVENVARGYRSVSQNLRHASIESSENLYGFLSQFQMLRVVEDFFEEESKDGSLGINSFLQRWRTHDKINSADLKFQEPVLSLRGVLLHSFDQRNPSSKLETAYDDSMLELLAKSRECGRLEFAENCANCISSLSDRSLKKDLEIAKNHWARGDQDIARHILGKLIKKSNPDICDLYPNMLLLHGEWLSESMSERPTVILEKYLLRSVQIFEKKTVAGQTEWTKAHFVLAKYADEQYQNLSKYMKSDLYAEKIAHLAKAKVDVAAIANVADGDVRRSAISLKRQSNIDEDEIQRICDEKKKFLLLALRHYLRGLKDCNEQDLLVFRAVALWMENAESIDTKFCTMVNQLVASEYLPSYKYVVVLHQLSARLNGTSSSCSGKMGDNIMNILSKCVQQHPYHTLPVLLTQSLLHADQPGGSANRQQNIENRVAAALRLVDALKQHKIWGSLTIKMARLWEALIQLANVREGKNSSTLSVLIPNNAEIKRLNGLEIVPVPTATLQVSPSGEYADIIGIHSFEPTYGLVGGINSPKRISCIGTNGIKFNMLLKGQDDLRQDAVMQQVFSVMNKLLQTEPKTKARRLHVRTYKVVPLSQRTGILEWCENTLTFGCYLVGENDANGAHFKYRPTDYTPLECRRKMLAVKDCGDNEKKYSTFMSILEHFKPVFRHFFFENFKEAGAYFERRLAYTRSVATNSMVGYILGLGDRHVLNILVDKTTAELIHIDLGVAFEQGRILPAPETIPFRLTRDIIDGMGVAGVEGVFRKSSEMTLEVLRNNSEIILTILEVLLYDPLYMWTLTQDRMRKVQPTDSNKSLNKTAGSVFNVGNAGDADTLNARNSSAARVLLRLRQKLAGVEESGTSASALSVPGHVSLLIQHAMEPERLSRLFPGWQPYL